MSLIGKPTPLLDGGIKATGKIQYVGDMPFPGLLHARPVTSIYPHARILSIKSEAARELPGVVAVITADDLPAVTPSSRHALLLARERALFVGHPIALVLAESEQAALDAVGLVQVEYEPLPAALDMDQAREAAAPKVWPGGKPGAAESAAAHGADVGGDGAVDDSGNLTSQHTFARGDVEAGLAQADVIVELTFSTQGMHQAYLETQSVIVQPDPITDGVNIWTSTQGIFDCRQSTAAVLGVPEADVRVRGMPVGGGFGGKWPLYEPLVALAASAVNHPVRLTLTRAEDMLAANPVHPGRLHVRLGARSDGTLVALAADIIFEAGCYPSAPAGNAGLLLGSMYKVEHLSISVAEVLTNKPSVGAYRAPGGPQAAFAIESAMDALARELDLDPVELRLRNAVAAGDPMANGVEWPNIGMREVLQAVQEHPVWVGRAQARSAGRGVGFAIGGWPGSTQPSAATCNLDRDGILRVQVAVVDLTGTTTAFAALAADAFGVPTERVRVTVGDTDNAPYSGGTGGSKIMYTVGPAVILAAKDVLRQVFEIAAQELEADVDDLEIFDSQVRVRGVPDSAIELGILARKAMEFGGRYAPIIGSGRHVDTNISPAFCAQLAEVEVDPETGIVRVDRIIVFQDVGRAINPLTIEGQMMGGAVQGIGWALYEDLAYDENGQLQAATFMDYAVPNVLQAGKSIETVLVEVPSEHGPLGARGVGEPPVIPTAAAIANAITDATGVRLTALPMTPEKIFTALQES